jgi:hypothetical protein
LGSRDSASSMPISNDEPPPPPRGGRSLRSVDVEGGGEQRGDVAPGAALNRGSGRKTLPEYLQGMQHGETLTAKERYKDQRRVRSQRSFVKVHKNSSSSIHDSLEYALTNQKAPPGIPSDAWKKADGEHDDGRVLHDAIDDDAKKHKRRPPLPFFVRAADTAYLLDFEGSFCRYWDVITAVLLIFVALMTPFELGFLTTNVDTSGGLALFVINRLVDFVFLMDIFVQANTAFVDKR